MVSSTNFGRLNTQHFHVKWEPGFWECTEVYPRHFLHPRTSKVIGGLANAIGALTAAASETLPTGNLFARLDNWLMSSRSQLFSLASYCLHAIRIVFT